MFKSCTLQYFQVLSIAMFLVVRTVVTIWQLNASRIWISSTYHDVTILIFAFFIIMKNLKHLAIMSFLISASCHRGCISKFRRTVVLFSGRRQSSQSVWRRQFRYVNLDSEHQFFYYLAWKFDCKSCLKLEGFCFKCKMAFFIRSYVECYEHHR